MHRWFVLHVRTGAESDVLNVLQRDLPYLQSFVPQRILNECSGGTWKMVTRTIFPGYVFIETFMDAEMYYRLIAIPGMIRILGNELGPVPVPENEMRTVLMLARNGKPLDISELYVEGDEIKITSGPLVGLEGQIIKIDARRYRAKVNINLMGEPRVVELGVKIIEKI